MNALARSNESVVQMLRNAAEREPAAEAIVVAGGARQSYRDLVDRTSSLAAFLSIAFGTRTRIGVLLPNGIGLVEALFGILTSGNQAVLLNPSYTARELAAILPDAEMRAVFASSEHLMQLEAAMGETGLESRILRLDDGSLSNDAALIKAGRSLPLPQLADLALLQFTGGTTGKPKGVMLSHRTLSLNICQRDALLPSRPGVERFLCMTPLFHAYALAMALFPAVYSAGTLVVLPRYRPEAALGILAEERITMFAGAPTIYNGLVAHPSFPKTDYSSLRGAFSGAAPLSVEVLSAWEVVTNVPIYEGYGLTEATAILSFNPMEGARKAGSVGLPLPETQIEIVDLESGQKQLPAGEVGEVRARGPQMMVGYRNRAHDTAAILRGEWLYTGDVGYLDSDGYLFLESRKSDMAIVSGYNVYPREIEEVLYLHPAVLEAIAVGLPDPYRGESMFVLVSIRDGMQVQNDELIAHCARNLAKYKVPVRIQLAEQLPRTGAGKLDRKLAKTMLLKESA